MTMKTSGMDLHSGMKNKSPASTDKSMSIPKGNTVNDGQREKTAKTPASIGGRCA